MFVVPLKGDRIETKDGMSFTVLSYSNYKEQGPAVYVEYIGGVSSDAVYFADIIKINNTTVNFISASKVFKSNGAIKRKIHLPQIADTIIVKENNISNTYKIIGLTLHKRGDLAKGLQVEVQDLETKEKLRFKLNSILDLSRDIGNDLFSREIFLKYYNDYTGSNK